MSEPTPEQIEQPEVEPVEADDAGHDEDTPAEAPSEDGSDAQPQEGTPVSEAENPNP